MKKVVLALVLVSLLVGVWLAVFKLSYGLLSWIVSLENNWEYFVAAFIAFYATVAVLGLIVGLSGGADGNPFWRGRRANRRKGR